MLNRRVALRLFEMSTKTEPQTQPKTVTLRIRTRARTGTCSGLEFVFAVIWLFAFCCYAHKSHKTRATLCTLRLGRLPQIRVKCSVYLNRLMRFVVYLYIYLTCAASRPAPTRKHKQLTTASSSNRLVVGIVRTFCSVIRRVWRRQRRRRRRHDAAAAATLTPAFPLANRLSADKRSTPHESSTTIGTNDAIPCRWPEQLRHPDTRSTAPRKNIAEWKSSWAAKCWVSFFSSRWVEFLLRYWSLVILPIALLTNISRQILWHHWRLLGKEKG